MSGFYDPARRAADDAWRAVLRRDPCSYCGRRPDEIPAELPHKINGVGTAMTIDHIHPKGSGEPRHHWSNQTGACWGCNHKRGATGLLVFLVTYYATIVRFVPGPNNARNKLAKARRRAQKAQRRAAKVAESVGLEPTTPNGANA